MKNLKTLTDDELVSLYVSSVDEAFDTILERYKDRLYSYILYSVKKTDLADDLFQETFVKAIVNIRSGKYVNTGKLYPWLTRIAHNLIVDKYRFEKTENTISIDENEIDFYNNHDLWETSIENIMVDEQTLKDVQELMELLPENQKTIIMMRFYQDLSFKEISDMTGVSINTALGRMRYAIMNLRRMATEHHIFRS